MSASYVSSSLYVDRIFNDFHLLTPWKLRKLFNITEWWWLISAILFWRVGGFMGNNKLCQSNICRVGASDLSFWRFGWFETCSVGAYICLIVALQIHQHAKKKCLKSDTILHSYFERFLINFRCVVKCIPLISGELKRLLWLYCCLFPTSSSS